MKKFLRENKGVIIFYAELVIITLIVLNNLQKGSDKMANDDIIKIGLLILISVVIGAIITYVKFDYNRYDVNRDGKVTSADYVEIKNYIMEK